MLGNTPHVRSLSKKAKVTSSAKKAFRGELTYANMLFLASKFRSQSQDSQTILHQLLHRSCMKLSMKLLKDVKGTWFYHHHPPGGIHQPDQPVHAIPRTQYVASCPTCEGYTSPLRPWFLRASTELHGFAFRTSKRNWSVGRSVWRLELVSVAVSVLRRWLCEDQHS